MLLLAHTICIPYRLLFCECSIQCTMLLYLDDLLAFYKLHQTRGMAHARKFCEQKQMKNYGKFIFEVKTSESHELLCWHRKYLMCSFSPCLPVYPPRYLDCGKNNNIGRKRGGNSVREKIKGCTFLARCVAFDAILHNVINDDRHRCEWKNRNRCIFIVTSER